MPLPTTFPADATAYTGDGNVGGVVSRAADAAVAIRSRDDLSGSTSTEKRLNHNINYGVRKGDKVKEFISEENDATRSSLRSNIHSIHSGSSSGVSVSLSVLDDGGVRKSRRTSMTEDGMNLITRPPPKSTETAKANPRPISDDLVAKSSMSLLVESSMSLFVYEREIEEEAAKRVSAVMSDQCMGGDGYKMSSTRQARVDKLVHPPPTPLLDASSKQNASAASMLSSTGSTSYKIPHESSANRERGRMLGTNEDESQHQPAEHRPLAIKTMFDGMRDISSNEYYGKGEGVIPENIIEDTSTPMSMSTISYHGGGSDNAADIDPTTATARFGRLLQECRKLTETIGNDTILSNSSSGINSSSNINDKMNSSVDKGGSSSVANHPSSTASHSALHYRSTVSAAIPVSDTLKLRQRRGDSSSGLPSIASKHSNSVRNNSALGTATSTKTILRRGSLNNESILSDLSLGVDVMYGEVDGDVNKSDTTRVDDETASFNPKLLENTINNTVAVEGVEVGTELSMVGNAEKRKMSKEKTKEMKFRTNQIAHGKEFRPRGEEAHLTNVDSKEGGSGGGDYSWLSYTTKGENVETPKSGVKSKTSPLNDVKIRVPKYTKSFSTTSYSTDFSEDSGGLLVGFGHRRRSVGGEASSISNSDSSNSFSSDCGDSSSDPSVGTGSFSSNASSSESESDESSGLPAIARHEMRVPSSTDSQSDVISALSFGGASTLMALQALKTSLSSPGSPGVLGGDGSIPRRSPPGSMNLLETECNARTESDASALEPQRSNNDLQIQPSPHMTRSGSIDPYLGLEKLDEMSELNASFPEDILAAGHFNSSNQNLFTSPAPSNENSCATTNVPDHSRSSSSVLPLKKVVSTTSSAKPSADLCIVDGDESSILGHEATTDSSLICQRSHLSAQRKANCTNSISSSLLANSCTHLRSGSHSSEIVSSATVGKSGELFSGSSSTSRSLSSNGRMQQILSTEGSRQLAGIKTIEASFVPAEARKLIVEMQENTYHEGNQMQKKYQGSGESPLEYIKSNMNDDLSFMSPVVSRARNSFTRSTPDVESQIQSLNALNESSTITHHELYEDFPNLVRGTYELKEDSEIIGLSDQSDIFVENAVSSELECNSAGSAHDRVSTDQKKRLPFDMRSIKSGDDYNFIGDELYEDFPHMSHDGDIIVFQRNKSSRVLLTNEETDWKKPWNTSSKKHLMEAASNRGGEVNIQLLRSKSFTSGQEIDLQSSVDENSSDGSMALFESKQALEKMGLFTAAPDSEVDHENFSCELKTPAIEEETQNRKRVSRSSNASSSVTEWDFSGSRESGALTNGNNDKTKELPPGSTKTGLSSECVKELDFIESSKLDMAPSRKTEEHFEHEHDNPQEKSLSVRTLASASKKMTDMFQSKLLKNHRQTKNDEPYDDGSSSFCISEKSAKSDVQSPQSLQERFPIEGVNSSPLGDEDEVGGVDDLSQKSKQDDESLPSMIIHSYSKSVDGAFYESGNSLSLQVPRQGESIVDENSSDDDTSEEEIQRSSKRSSQKICKCQKRTILLLVASFFSLLIVAIVAGVVTKHLRKSSDNSSDPTQVTQPPPTTVPTQPPVNVIPHWTQVGGDLVGEFSEDEAGFSISVSEDGSRAIVGARRNKRDGLRNRGAARIFEFDINSNSFVPIWDVVGEAAGDQCGYSASMTRNGTRVAVGCIGSDKNGKNAGQVHIYDEDKFSKMWNLVQNLVGEKEYSLFGASISFSQDGAKIIVGAPYYSEGADVIKSGRTYVYAEMNDAEWVQLGGPMYGKSSNELFGWSVSFSPTAPFVAVGAPLLEGSSGSGYVKVYAFQENDWQEYGDQMMLGVAGDRFGFSVSLAGDYTYQRVAIGAPGMSINGEGSGLVSVYESDGPGGWQRSGDDLLGDSLGENLGYAVSMTSDGSRVIVGVPTKMVDGVSVGQVQVVDISYDGLVSAGAISGREGDNFGASVSVSHDGRLVYGGSPKTNLIRAFGEIRSPQKKRQIDFSS